MGVTGKAGKFVDPHSFLKMCSFFLISGSGLTLKRIKVSGEGALCFEVLLF